MPKQPRSRVSFFLLPVLVIMAALFLQACEEPPKHIMRVRVTSGNQQYANRTQPVTLPISGMTMNVYTQPVVLEGDIVNVELARVQMGLGLLIQLSEIGARQLYRVTGSSQGEKLVLFINDQPVGVRVIDAPMQDGQFFTFVEMRDQALIELFPELKESVRRAQALKN